MKMYLARFGEITEVEIAGRTGRLANDRLVIFPDGRHELETTNWQWFRITRFEAKEAMIEQYTKEHFDLTEKLRTVEALLAKARKA